MSPDHAAAAAFLEQDMLATIPLARAMQLRVADFDGTSLRLRAPLAANVNDKGCAFGGSLASLLTLACWGLARLALRAADFEPDIYVQDSQIEYSAPVRTDIEVDAGAAQEHSLADFVAMYAERGKARITLLASAAGVAGPATTLRARFVALKRKEENA